jgi:transcriptional regulator with XRE-family HTH domain
VAAEEADSRAWEEVGGRVREAREYLGLSQGDVAEALGVSRPAVSGIEAGKRKLSTLELRTLAGLLRRPYEYFIGGLDGAAQEDALSLALFNTTRELSDSDREQVLRFAEFLRGGPPPER